MSIQEILPPDLLCEQAEQLSCIEADQNDCLSSKLGIIVTMQVCPDGVTPCAAPNWCSLPENSCYNGIYQR